MRLDLFLKLKYRSNAEILCWY